MKIKALLLIPLLSFSTFIYAEDLEEIRAKQFTTQLSAYMEKHSENLALITKYAEKKDRTPGEDRLYFWTLCNTVTNLERGEKLIKDNPEFSQYLNGNVIASLEENLDFHKHVTSLLVGTENECKS
ncbi:hypothetical protein ACODTP_17645 [Acinetobacter pittii]|uniref:hypothetical protein n=1 Tax=Acinetobacter pittii TaxID=48296 RepID=UPI003B42FB6A